MQDPISTTSSPGPIFWIVMGAIIIFEIAAMWKVFQKAGKPGWASIIPIYNAIVLIEIAGKPVWWFLLYFIPLVNIVIGVIVVHNVAKNFGKDVGFTLGLIFLGFIFYPILAWGDAEYQAPVPQYQGA